MRCSAPGTLTRRRASSRSRPRGPNVLVMGKKFADNFTALIEAGPLDEGISITETGAALYERYVVTNTAPGGSSFSPDQHCQGWTSADPAYKARVGLNAYLWTHPSGPHGRNNRRGSGLRATRAIRQNSASTASRSQCRRVEPRFQDADKRPPDAPPNPQAIRDAHARGAHALPVGAAPPHLVHRRPHG